MVDDLELVRAFYDAEDPVPAGRSPRQAIRQRLLAEIAISEPAGLVTAGRTATRGRHRRSNRLGLIAGAAVVTVVAAAGIAAAAGLLAWHGQKAGVSFMNSPNPADVPGAVVQATIPGPSSTVLRVVTDLVDNGPTHVEDCEAVELTGPGGQPEQVKGNGGCSLLSAATGSSITGSQAHQLTPSVSLGDWQAPSGTNINIISGQTPPQGFTAVALRDSSGPVTAKEPVTDGYYVTYLPAASLANSQDLIFYNAAGVVISVQNLEG